MNGLRTHRRYIVVAALAVGLASSACLGQDFLAAPLELGSLDHGWRVNVESNEEFGVSLVANPLYPDVPWRLAESDAGVVRLTGTEHDVDACAPGAENPCPEGAAQEPFLPVTTFRFVGAEAGESALDFELVVDGEVVDVCEYTISVVEDACEGDVGIAANRCGLGTRQPEYGEVAIFDYGRTLNLGPGETFAVTLAANAMHPDAPWVVAEMDPGVLTLVTTEEDPARTPGDWDTSDREKPWHFLPIWRLTFEAVETGETPLVLEVVVDGEPVEVFEITVSVAGEGNGA